MIFWCFRSRYCYLKKFMGKFNILTKFIKIKILIQEKSEKNIFLTVRDMPRHALDKGEMSSPRAKFSI